MAAVGTAIAGTGGVTVADELTEALNALSAKVDAMRSELARLTAMAAELEPMLAMARDFDPDSMPKGLRMILGMK